MSLTHNLLDLFVLGVALLDLFHHYHAGTLRKRWVIAAVIGVLTVFGGDIGFEWLQQRIVRHSVEERITETLQPNNPQTLVEISRNVLYDEPIVSATLRELIDKGMVTSDDIQLGKHDDSNQHLVRLYRINTSQISAYKENIQ
jgi:hypothetical protein